jgi:3-oxo-5-alpha-steroid 4-dehydrogenase 1
MIPVITGENLTSLCYAWIFLAMIVFISLLFISAPYGKYISKEWGTLIPNKLGWIIMESISPIALSIFFWNGSLPKNNSLIFIYGLWVFHYVYRSFLFPMKTATDGKKIPFTIVLMAVFFNCVNGYTNGIYLGEYALHIDSDYYLHPRFVSGFIVFIGGFITHYIADDILINLRKKQGPGYHIPQGFLYRYISCPNYFGEMLEWLGFAIICGSFPAWVFFIWTVANLLPRALSHHKWYHNTFSDYPKNRKAIIPSIL